MDCVPATSLVKTLERKRELNREAQRKHRMFHDMSIKVFFLPRRRRKQITNHVCLAESHFRKKNEAARA